MTGVTNFSGSAQRVLFLSRAMFDVHASSRRVSRFSNPTVPPTPFHPVVMKTIIVHSVASLLFNLWYTVRATAKPLVALYLTIVISIGSVIFHPHLPFVLFVVPFILMLITFHLALQLLVRITCLLTAFDVGIDLVAVL
ncbi:hypothetical protein EXIGLDRAFT_774854 [Exidia glandulosa HHB12029]|uniref:Uncharacterized protein n=1 Tax=Exidia glandulosa HHB12029 TaxID=1314781 RepID=A0A165ZWA4_EXIGL|nr:hypothetical protein EXIGLDRAFT_774854 [Exidia glandulosa HHB12029]